MAAGILLLGAAALLYTILLNIRDTFSFIEDFIYWWRHSVRFTYSGVATIAFLLGYILPYPLNWLFFDQSEALSKAIKEEGESFEQMLEKAIDKTKMVSITLKTNKVYIGAVTSNYLPGGNRKYLKIIPFYSGYRNQEDMRIFITTNYARVYERMENGEIPGLSDKEDFELIILVTEIISINFFDLEAYKLFQESA